MKSKLEIQNFRQEPMIGLPLFGKLLGELALILLPSWMSLQLQHLRVKYPSNPPHLIGWGISGHHIEHFRRLVPHHLPVKQDKHSPP